LGVLSREPVDSKRTSIRPVFNLSLQKRLALLATAFLFPLGGATFLLPWFLALKILRIAREHRFDWVRSPFDFPVAVFLSLALVAGVLSPLRGIALGSWVLAALAFVVVLQVILDALRQTPATVRFLHKGFTLGALAAAVYGLVVFFSRPLDTLPPDRAQLLTLGPQALGFGLMACIFLSLPLLEEPFPWPLISVLTLVVCAVAVFATFNRAALYGLAAGGLTHVGLGRRKLPMSLLAVAAVSLVLGLMVAATTPTIQHALAHALNYAGFASGPNEGNTVLRRTLQFLFSWAGNNDRLAIWQIDLRVIRHYPWFGVGLGGFRSIGQEWGVGIPGADTLPAGTPPHSLYLNLAAEVGIPGALAFLTLPVLAIREALKSRDTYHIAQIACMAGMLAAETRDGILMGYHMSLGFILILGMMGARGGSPEGGPSTSRLP
jgi:putative inorganic carbon (hco3(-)) transporter